MKYFKELHPNNGHGDPITYYWKYEKRTTFIYIPDDDRWLNKKTDGGLGDGRLCAFIKNGDAYTESTFTEITQGEWFLEKI